VAGGERRHAPVRYLERGPGGGRGGEDEGVGCRRLRYLLRNTPYDPGFTVAPVLGSTGTFHPSGGPRAMTIWQGVDPPAETPGIDRYIRGSERR
jgi:hypothetical protein